MTHADIQELLGAYVLDAVDADEAAEVERHLTECPHCAAEAAAHREVTALLAGRHPEAPPALWDRIAASLEPAPPAGFADQVPLHRPSRWRAAAAAAVAAVAAAVVALLAAETVHLNHQVSTLRTTVASAGVQVEVNAALLGPHSEVVLRGAGGKPVATALVVPGGQAFVVGSRLPALASDRTYQLWAAYGDRVVSVALLGAQPATVAFRLDPGAAQLMVTAEPAGGVVAPTTPVLAQAAL